MKPDLSKVVTRHSMESALVGMLNRDPCSIQTKVNADFVRQIEDQKNPSEVYSQEMKALLSQELGNSYKENKDSLEKLKEEQDAIRRWQREGPDGVLQNLEKNGMSFQMGLQKKRALQEERGRKFVDENRIKEQRISSLVTKNEDPFVFSHGSENYQKMQEAEKVRANNVLGFQVETKKQQQMIMRNEKEELLCRRKLYEEQLELKKQMEKQQRLDKQARYSHDLQALAEEQRRKRMRANESMPLPPKHNPITNPIEYHIENPYLLKRMQDRHR